MDVNNKTFYLLHVSFVEIFTALNIEDQMIINVEKEDQLMIIM